MSAASVSPSPPSRRKPKAKQASPSPVPQKIPQKRKSKKVAQFLERPPVAGSFGLCPARTPKDLYVRNAMWGGGTGSVTNGKELGLTVVDFFDYSSTDSTAGAIPQFVSNYYWQIDQNLFNDTIALESSSTFCRVRKLCVWVLPQKGFSLPNNADLPNTTNAQAMYTVNCQVPGVPSAVSQDTASLREAYATNTQVTNILPQIDTRWKKVFSCNLQKTFQSGVVRPFFSGPGSSRSGTDQCLFQMSIVNSTNGLPYFPSADEPNGVQGIRVKVQLLVDQPILPEQAANLTVFRNEEFSLPDTAQNGVSFTGTTEQYVQMNLRSVMDNFS